LKVIKAFDSKWMLERLKEEFPTLTGIGTVNGELVVVAEEAEKKLIIEKLKKEGWIE